MFLRRRAGVMAGMSASVVMRWLKAVTVQPRWNG
jgi:hypothetical protein